MKSRLILLCAMLWFSTQALAITEINERDAKKTLNLAQKKLDREIENKEKLNNKIEIIEQDMAKTKETLIETATLIRRNEENLQDLESRIDRLENSKTVIEEKLHRDRGTISRLILTLQRLRQSPPEAMLARPESPYKTAQSALLMGQLIPAIERHTQALKKNLETLSTVSTDLEQERKNHLALSDSLKAQQTTLSSLLDTRQSIYKQTHLDLQKREQNIQNISYKAQNLEDLVKKLKDEELRERERLKAQKDKTSIKKEAEIAALSQRLTAPKTPLPNAEGQPQLPVSGIIKVGYKAKDNLGAPSNGLTIEGRDGALVIAPLSGKIQFAGTFKKYGKIVIIEHDDGYHSLVAGLEKIDTVVGDYVQTGEPIGALPQAGSANAPPNVYYELRRHGKPVNPAKKFHNLG